MTIVDCIQNTAVLNDCVKKMYFFSITLVTSRSKVHYRFIACIIHTISHYTYIIYTRKTSFDENDSSVLCSTRLINKTRIFVYILYNNILHIIFSVAYDDDG